MAESADRGMFGRRRRANVKGGRQHRHEVWVTPDEEGRLDLLARAQKVTIPRLLVESALASDAPVTAAQQKEAIAELFAVHRLLAAVSNNVNQLARAANASGEIQPGTADALVKVREVAARIDEVIDELGAGQ